MSYFVKPVLPEKDIWIFAHIMTTDGKEYFLGTDKDSLTGDVKVIKIERRNEKIPYA